MNSGITRWKITPSYSGLCISLPETGSFHALVPRARPIKLATALGALLGNSSHRISPAEVCITAAGSLAGAAAAPFLAVLDGALWVVFLLVVCPAAAIAKHSRINASRAVFAPMGG